MTESLDQLMERASEALTRMDYLTCEALCQQALAMAREQNRWPDYARILLPLQEARRQRRMIAAEGVIRLGTADLEEPVSRWLDSLSPGGCLVVTPPHGREQARELDALARQQRRYVEVLYAEPASSQERWTLHAFRGPAVTCDMPAPPASWQNAWLTAGGDDVATPADWFLNAAEWLGDAALAQVDPALPLPAQLAQMEQMLEVVSNHEILHQRLGDAARAMR